jgi:RNA polymerase sigma-70 factor (ECF subfamily)
METTWRPGDAGGGGDAASSEPGAGDAPVAGLEISRRQETRGRSVSPVELVERARGGDRRAFELLYRLQFPSIARQVAVLVRDRERAEDVTAQTFLLAWKGLPSLRRADRFDSWLSRIAHHAAMSELRQRTTSRLDDAAEPEDGGLLESPERMLGLRSEVEELREALIELPGDQRAVLLLRFIRDLPHSEVARLLGRSEEATRALQYRALRSMQRILAERGG